MRWILCAATALGLGGCYSGVGDLDGAGGASADGADAGDDGPVPQEVADEVGVSGLRRLSIVEYEQTIVDLLGLTPQQVQELLPADTLTPFDNDFTTQIASEALIKGLELVAGDIAEQVVASPQLREAIVPCEPTGPDDAACYREFLASFGRRALRRPLADAELERFGTLLYRAVEADDFWAGVGAALRLLLQHPEFVYRVEVGEPVDETPQLHRLDGFEVGARLSYFLIGSTPPDWLLDAAQAGDLDGASGITSAATTLLDDPRARARMARFHSLWLAYENLSREGIYGDMHAETQALVERVVFDDRGPWADMLTATETFVTPELAEHYGLSVPAEAAWVPYGDSGRGGLLSHGAFLSVGAKFGDTSPTQRGLLVRTKLFCQEIPLPPPELMVDVCEPPQADPNDCKIDQYFMWQEEACQHCHRLMDPIGFGLEAYDASGAFRTAEADRPECTIPGDGDFAGVGTFNGPAQLADLALQSGMVEDCVARQLYRFAVGRTELDDHDEVFLERLVADGSGADGLSMMEFIGAYVASDAFRYRREES